MRARLLGFPENEDTGMTAEITLLLGRAAAGDEQALAQVVAWAYDDLERLATRRLRRSFGARAEALTLEPAALVNETFLRMLEDASQREREVLSAFRYQRNDVLLHGDVSVLPHARRAWASWNYHVGRERSSLAALLGAASAVWQRVQSSPFDVTLQRRDRCHRGSIRGTARSL